MVRVGFAQIREATPEFLAFAAQFGATDVLLAEPGLPAHGGRWHLKDLVRLRLTVERYGLHLEAVEAMPARASPSQSRNDRRVRRGRWMGTNRVCETWLRLLTFVGNGTIAVPTTNVEERCCRPFAPV